MLKSLVCLRNAQALSEYLKGRVQEAEEIIHAVTEEHAQEFKQLKGTSLVTRSYNKYHLDNIVAFPSGTGTKFVINSTSPSMMPCPTGSQRHAGYQTTSLTGQWKLTEC